MSDVTYHLQGAYTHYKNGNYSGAEKWVAEILRHKPFMEDALHLGAMIALAQGNVPIATQRIELALGRTPDNVEMLNTLGNIHAARHDPVRAEKSYLAALALQEDYLAPRQNLAFLLLKHFQPHLAVPHFENLIAVKPNNETYKLGCAQALKGCARYDDALKILSGVTHDEALDKAANLSAQILFLSGDDKGGVEANASKFHTNPEAVDRFAQISHMNGNWKTARKTLKNLAVAPETKPHVIAQIAKAIFRAGDAQEALSVLRLVPQTPQTLSVRSEVQLSLAQADAAFEDAEAALKMVPGKPEFMAHYARAALASGRVEACMHAAQSALKLNPNDQFWIAMLATGGRVKGQNFGYYYDYEKFVRCYDLQAPNGYLNMAAFNAALKSTLIEQHEFKKAPLDQSLRSGTQTRSDLRFNSNPVVQDFFTAIDQPIRDYMRAIGKDSRHPLSRRNTGDYRLSGAWSVALTAGGYHVNHVHPEGWISSSYYVDVPSEVGDKTSKAGWIQFGQPPEEISNVLPNLTAEKIVQPKPGRLVLFPSYMWHGTIPITGKDPRITLPFDVVPA